VEKQLISNNYELRITKKASPKDLNVDKPVYSGMKSAEQAENRITIAHPHDF
jgi:hypothetical protein